MFYEPNQTIFQCQCFLGGASTPILTKSKNVILFSLACHKCWNNFWNVCWQTKFMTKNVNNSETCFMFSLPRDVLIFQENKKININWENVSFFRRSLFPRLEGEMWTKKSPRPHHQDKTISLVSLSVLVLNTYKTT